MTTPSRDHAEPQSRGGFGQSRVQVAGLLAIGLAMAIVPLVWRAATAWSAAPSAHAPASYLPAVLAPRVKLPFDPGPIEGLRILNPTFVYIGDSMTGRVDAAYFTQLSDLTIAPLVSNATGSAFWYLQFKNNVAASGIRPRWVVVFFRDTNLTDPIWRLPMGYGDGLDRVALDREDELNAVVAARTHGAFFHVHAWLNRIYDLDRARDVVDPQLSQWAARVVAGRRGAQALTGEMNTAFDLDHLRPVPGADFEAAQDRDADFQAQVGTSVLPLFLKTAEAHHLRLCFVRVLRRPQNGRPASESPALTKYARDLRRYLEPQGAVLVDDRDDPEMAALPYGDGDHITREASRRYTELFQKTLSRLPR